MSESTIAMHAGLTTHDQELLGRIVQRVREKGFSFGPCLPDDALTAFEQQHQVSLPSDYRAFLAQVGNGGHGPTQTGLLPLEGRRTVDQPFPFMDPTDTGDPDLPDADALFERGRDGTLDLAHDQNGSYLLVVTGVVAGTVWMTGDDGRFDPCLPSGTFLQWYWEWLNASGCWDPDTW